MRACNLGKVSKLGMAIILAVITMMSLLSVQRQDILSSYAPSSLSEAEDDGNNLFLNYNHEENSNGKWRQLTGGQISRLAKLGRILYLKDEVPAVDPDKNFTILVWKYGSFLDNRHVKRYSEERHDPFEFCSVKNCRLTYNNDELKTADLVIFHLQLTTSPKDVAPQENRNPKQVWAFLTDESPHHTFMHGNEKLADFNNIFNWSMTYRMDSDIPVPYGRTVQRETPNEGYKFNIYSWLLTRRHDVLATVLGSNCGSKNHRWEYIKQLQKHMLVDIYGSCGKLKCAGHFSRDCPEISQYMFYLSFENSNCEEYVTEKIWWNAYSKNTIPVVMGASKSSYANLLPPHSYINVEDFATPQDLASYLLYLSNSPSELQRYFQWKKHFKVLNEHGYFQSVSYHYCRACEALNFNNRSAKVYGDLGKFWNVKADCYPAWDQQ